MTSDIPSPDKKTLRKQLRQARNAIPAPYRLHAAWQVARLAMRLGALKRGRRIGFYIPAKGELDILPLIQRAQALHLACHLPIVPGPRQKKLWFARIGEHDHLWTLNRFGIPEYHDFRRRRMRASQMDWIFVPLMGFDTRGYRLGMGGGFYDASLAFLRLRRQWRRPKLVGVAFDLQKVAFVPNDPWDVPLDYVITERRIYRCTRQG